MCQVPAVTGLPAFVPRAALTVPRIFLHLAYSNIPGAGIGVFSTLTLPSGVRFGPYRGRRLKTALDSGYEWQIYDRNNKPCHVVDASDANNSNWMRYVNCARRYSEQNLVAFQYQGELYYRTVKIVPRFTELLVFYGGEFAGRLGLDLRRYSWPCACPRCQPRLSATNAAKTNKGKTQNEEKKETDLKENINSRQALLATQKEPKTNKTKSQNKQMKKTEIKDDVNSDEKSSRPFFIISS
ncbi:histone-lysine N-methyltransferase PRDM7-like [Cydia pomonella]|uniref:histone-lysine N-methyltransferase PRDM7-like n=1 Tax=Cydia pomonella TaxID=82600 RepID=UPI002ADE8BD6|nr:histone-lysine N-methyltransferase PRDM7-like [Cydia pomonella]